MPVIADALISIASTQLQFLDHIYPLSCSCLSPLPGASRFDKLLLLTEKLAANFDATDLNARPTAQSDFRDCLQNLKTFLQNDSHNVPTPPPIPITGSTRHKPTTDTGIDLVGHTFQDTSRGLCRIIGTDTYIDDDGVLWHTLQYTSSKYPKQDARISKVSEIRSWLRRRGSAPPPKPTPKPTVPITIRYELPAPLRNAPDPKSPFFRTILHLSPSPKLARTTYAYAELCPPASATPHLTQSYPPHSTHIQTSFPLL